MGDNSCVVCGHREAAAGYVCDHDQQRLTEQLTGLGAKLAKLALALVPTADPGGERVTVCPTDAPAPVRVDVLSLLGPGTQRLSAAAMADMLHPWVRRWRTVELLTVTTAAGTSVEREIVTWHQEIARDGLAAYSNTRQIDNLPPYTADADMVAILHDDQVGLVPPRPWAHSWARRWKEALGQHQRPVRYTRGWDKSPQATAAAPDRYIREHLHGQEREKIASTVLGIRGELPAAQRPDDPLGDHWRQRFGPADIGHQLAADLAYLQQTLPAACDRDLDIAVFAGQLRALAEELNTVLGEQPDQYWLGRCPAELTNRTTATTRLCGAGIWQDPYASQVTCLRCRSAWGPSKAELLRLAIAIRKAWPADRRRRYTDLEKRSMPAPTCPECLAAVQVRWREATARPDRYRTWQPVAAVCPNGCDTGRLI